jgi:hypothetical protein
MKKPKTITVKAQEIRSKSLATPKPAVITNGVSPDLADLARKLAHGEAFRVYAELNMAMRLIDDEIRRAKKALDGDHDEVTRGAKGLLLAGLEGERLGLEKQINRLIDRHFPLGMVV